ASSITPVLPSALETSAATGTTRPAVCGTRTRAASSDHPAPTGTGPHSSPQIPGPPRGRTATVPPSGPSLLPPPAASHEISLPRITASNLTVSPAGTGSV